MKARVWAEMAAREAAARAVLMRSRLAVGTTGAQAEHAAG